MKANLYITEMDVLAIFYINKSAKYLILKFWLSRQGFSVDFGACTKRHFECTLGSVT